MLECFWQKKLPLGQIGVFTLFLGLSIMIWSLGYNHKLFFLINKEHDLLPNKVWYFLNFISYSKYFILFSLLLIITLIKRQEKIINVLIVIVSFYLVFYLLKHVIAEARPFVVLDPQNFFWLNGFESSISNAYKSFPSGHTGQMAVVAFSINELFFKHKNKMQFFMLSLVVIIALARICTGWHWPLDVLASGLFSFILVKISFIINFRATRANL